MRFLLDQNISPALVELLSVLGHDVRHVRDLGLRSADDRVVLQAAVDLGAVLISSDTDFGELLARSNASSPSVILLRRQQGRRARRIAALLEANLDAVSEDLAMGSFVVLDSDRVRVRALPFQPAD